MRLLPNQDNSVKSTIGWARLHSGARRPVQLRVDAVFGTEAASYSVTLPFHEKGEAFVFLTGYISQIRFDGGDQTLDLTPLNRRSLLLRLSSSILKCAIRRPLRFLRFLAQLTHTALKYRTPGLLALLREYLGEVACVMNEYSVWLENYGGLTVDDSDCIRKRISAFERSPTFSVLMPVFNTPETYLRHAIDSVINQLYQNWELCIVDDASTDPRVKDVLNDYSDPRIRKHFRRANGHIAKASNDAYSQAHGEFVVLFDHDDELAPDALYFLAETVNARSVADILYSDSDKIDSVGRRFDPHFKPDFNPDLMKSYNLMTHLTCLRSTLFRDLGGFREDFDGSQDYDLFLRAIEHTAPDRIIHIPHILYHWRSFPGSVALGPQAKAYAHENARRAIGDHLKRLGMRAEVTSDSLGFHHARYAADDRSATAVICTRDRGELLRNLIEDLTLRTDYPDLEIIVIDNQSRESATREYLTELSERGIARVIPFDHPFNYSAMNNSGAAAARGSYLVLLNNDMRVITPEWLRLMIDVASQTGIGAVGAKLLYPDNRIQHAGIVLGMGGVAGHPLRGLPSTTLKFNGRAHVMQTVSAVTGACLVVRKDAFLSVGGFSEDLAVAFNDVDFCLKLAKTGCRNVLVPAATLYHLESASRGSDETEERGEPFRAENARMIQRWGLEFLQSDPNYNPNLSLSTEGCGPAFPPRTRPPWRELTARKDEASHDGSLPGFRVTGGRSGLDSEREASALHTP